LGRATAGRDVIVVDGEAWWRTKVVYAGIDYFRADNVDVPGQNFRVEFYLWFRWEGELDVENIGFVNEIFTEENTQEVLREDLDARIKYACFKHSASFLFPFDLRDFPFDTQWLPLQLAHRTRDTNEVIIVVDRDNLTTAPVNEIYPEEWTWVGRKDAAGTFTPATSFGDPAYTGRGGRASFSLYEAKLGIKRILFPYLVKMFLPLGIMIAITLLVFLVPRDAFDARMTLVMTALLSILVFHLAQAEALPAVGYLMRADYFFMITYVLVFTLTIKTVVVNVFVSADKDSVARWIDLVFAVVFLPLSAVAYIGLTVWSMMA
jgi:branched-chain amino acid transport system substrate-binding protein